MSPSTLVDHTSISVIFHTNSIGQRSMFPGKTWHLCARPYFQKGSEVNIHTVIEAKSFSY